MIWKLKEPLYSLNNGLRKFWLRVKTVFSKIGLKKLAGDEALYFKNDENSDLEGMISTHVDDFNLAGSENLWSLDRGDKESIRCLKGRNGKFRFIGLDVERFEDMIESSMYDYAAGLEDVKIRDLATKAGKKVLQEVDSKQGK